MADTTQKKQTEKKLTKKQVREEIFTRLSGALDEYKAKLGEKKFESKLKKASKLFVVDLKKAFKKEQKSNKVKSLPAKNN